MPEVSSDTDIALLQATFHLHAVNGRLVLEHTYCVNSVKRWEEGSSPPSVRQITSIVANHDCPRDSWEAKQDDSGWIE